MQFLLWLETHPPPPKRSACLQAPLKFELFPLSSSSTPQSAAPQRFQAPSSPRAFLLYPDTCTASSLTSFTSALRCHLLEAFPLTFHDLVTNFLGASTVPNQLETASLICYPLSLPQMQAGAATDIS